VKEGKSAVAACRLLWKLGLDLHVFFVCIFEATKGETRRENPI
jgi:hypothetical protein